MKKLSPFLLFFALVITFNLYSEFQAGVNSEIVGEYYATPALKWDDSGKVIENIPIYKLLVSLRPQLIWKHKRNMVLLNIELFGALGSLEGSFGREGRLHGQIKVDTFYKGFFGESPLYIKFGKYHGDLPYDFGAFIETGQGEFGFQTEQSRLFYSVAFLEWFKNTDASGEVSYENERSHGEDEVAHIIGFDQKSNVGDFKARTLFTHSSKQLTLFPSLEHRVAGGGFDNVLFVGYGRSFPRSDYSTGGNVVGAREEVGFSFAKIVRTALLFGLLSGSGDSTNNYAAISIDNRDFPIQYGTHFDYIYRQAGNYHGVLSAGVRLELFPSPVAMWIGGSLLTTFPYNDDLETIGYLIAGEMKWNNILSESSSFVAAASWFIPGTLTVDRGDQLRHQGLQIIVKFQQEIF